MHPRLRALYTPRYYQRQFSSLYAWSNVGSSSYNAGQLILRHAMSHGVQFDFSYTFSNSIDLGSDTERTGELNGTCTYNSGGSFSEIINTFHPEYNRGVSDFDTRHLINGDWVIQLPFGSNQRFLSSGGRLVDGIVAGWQLSGLARWSSGLPFSVYGHRLAYQLAGGKQRRGYGSRSRCTARREWLAGGFRRPRCHQQRRGFRIARFVCPILVRLASATTSAAMATST